MKPITILITDDHRLIRESLSAVFSNDPRFKVVGLCANGEEAIISAISLRPDIVLMDINMPIIDGIEASKKILQYSTTTKVIGLSIHANPSVTKQMMADGVTGYVSKNSSLEELVTAVLEIYQDRKFICHEVKDNLASQVLEGGSEAPGVHSLSKRQLEIVRLIQKGYTSKKIAEEIHLSVNTIEAHRYNILRKLKLKNVASLINLMSNDPSQLISSN